MKTHCCLYIMKPFDFGEWIPAYAADIANVFFRCIPLVIQQYMMLFQQILPQILFGSDLWRNGEPLFLR